MKYELTSIADQDLTAMLWDGVNKHGLKQAEKYYHEVTDVFQRLCETPDLWRERPEISDLDPPLRLYTYKKHIIAYQIVGKQHIIIVRVRHGNDDWMDDLLGKK